jgi:hypothetical protein
MLKINSRLTLALGLTMWILISKEGFVSCTTSYTSIGCYETSGAASNDIFNESFDSLQCAFVALPNNIFGEFQNDVCFYFDVGSTMTVQLCLDVCTANIARNFTYAGLGW